MGQSSTIVCIGSANLEQIIRLNKSFREGAKNDIDEPILSAGGSAINHSCRLLAMGFGAIPLAPVGDDEVGENVIEVLRESLIKGNGQSASGFDDLIRSGRTTSASTLIIDPLGRRTIFTHEGTASKGFRRWLNGCLDNLKAPPDAVIVGHISADERGSITRGIINRFSEKGAYILVNLGRTQYEQGVEAFREVLGKVDCLQFELAEAKAFVQEDPEFKPKTPSIEEVLDHLIDSTETRSIVLTLAEAGAVAWHRDMGDQVLIAWPYDLEGIILDSTGAGDAYAAGMASTMAGPDRGTQQFENSLTIARNWAAYACTELGGARHPPNEQELQAFAGKNRELVLRAPQRMSRQEARHILRFFDITRRYSRFGFVTSA